MITKINPFVQIYEAFRGFTDPGAFYNLRKQSTGSKIVYSLIISILAALMICGFTVFQINTDKTLESTLAKLPEFSYLNGKFYCEQTYSVAAQDSYLILDSNVDKWDVSLLQQQAQGNTQKANKEFQKALDDSNVAEVMLLSNTNMVIYKKYTGQFSEMSLAELCGILKISALSKQAIVEGYKGFVVKVGLLCSLFVFPYQLGKLFFVSLMLSLVALIINSICGSKEQFSTLYWISFYMQSVILLIKIIGDSFLSFGGFALTIACLLFYICMMYRTLKSGEPVAKPVTSYNANDDLDDYLQNSYSAPETDRTFEAQTTSTQTIDTQSTDPYTSYNTDTFSDTNYNGSSSDIYNDTNYNRPSSDDTPENEEITKPVSGLSLKLKDD